MMNLFINGSNREKNCYTILKDIKKEDDELISLSRKDIKYCLGCNSCVKKLDKFCVLDDYVSQNIYQKIIDSNKIIIASPMYMSSITYSIIFFNLFIFTFYKNSIVIA